MKKLTCLLMIAFVAGVIGSCKPKEKCPAYGKYEVKEQKAVNS